MKKKILLSLLGIFAIVAGITAFSAYEAHVINVTAHIENALSVETTPIEFGTVFPQEYLEKQFTVNLSTSFMAEDRVDDVDYVIKQKPKPIWPIPRECELFSGEPTIEEARAYCHDHPEDLDCCYLSLCPYLSKTDGDPEDVNDVGVPSYYQGTSCTIPNPDYAVGRLAQSEQDTSDIWIVDLKVPPVKGYVGQDWPAGCPTVSEDSQDYGCDLWVEVTGISEGVHESECSPGAVWSCYTGLPGVCAEGTKTCDQEGFWGPCVQDNQPTTEDCDDELDNDCDGYTDCEDSDCSTFPDCQPGPTPECQPWDTQPCQTDLPGICALGTQTCDEFGFWGQLCVPPLPVNEICDDHLDNDCDGYTDCNDSDCAKDSACTQTTPSPFESYTSGDDFSSEFYGAAWRGQTFTPNLPHKITSVKLKLRKYTGSPTGLMTVSIRATSGELPTGADLCSGTKDVTTISTTPNWYEISLGGGTNLSAGVQYAIVFRHPNGSSSNNLQYYLDVTAPTYLEGRSIYSSNSGVSWGSSAGNDIMFEEWGI